MKSETIGKLAEALAKAQGEMENAEKNSVNPFHKNKYADLASVIDAIKEPLSKNGLSYVQYAEEENDKNYVITILMHTSGEWIAGKMRLLIQKQDMQGFGGSLTYGRRYALSAMIGISQEDDDGNTASGKMIELKKELPISIKKEEEPKIIIPPGWKITGPMWTEIKEMAHNAGWIDDRLMDEMKTRFKKVRPNDLIEKEYTELYHLLDTELKLRK